MPKKLEDIVKINISKDEPKALGIRRVKTVKTTVDPVAENKNRNADSDTQDHSHSKKTEIPYRQIINKESSSKSKLMLWLVAFGSIVILFFAFSVFFARATIIIHPKIEELTLNKGFTASKDPELASLPFEVVVISGEESSTIKASGEKKEYTKSATGRVILYNNYGFGSQILAIDTRLEGSNGKIYKTKTPVTIPGSDSVTGLPGSVEVEVYALEPGVEYNAEALDFKILGFKNTPKYNSFYGRSNGSISGGLVGFYSEISPIDKNLALVSMKNSLHQKLFKQVNAQIPEGYILYPNATSFSVDEENIPVAATEEQVNVSIKGTLASMLIKESALTDEIAKNSLDSYDGSPIYIKSIRDLKFSFSIKETLFWDSETVDFKLTGPIQIIYLVDANPLVSSLIGTPKSKFNNELKKYPNISSAELTIRPFWKTTFPDKIKDIKAEIVYP